MKISPRVLSLLFSAVLSFAVPADKPNIRVESPRFVYENVIANSVDRLNFRKWEYREFTGRKSSEGVRLVDGKAARPRPQGGSDEIMLRRVSFFGGTPDRPKFALAEFMHFAARGSSKQDGVVQVYGIEKERPILLQQIVFDAQAEGWGIEFAPETTTLEIRGRADDGTPHCCPKFLDVVTFNWSGGRFVQKSYKRVPIEKQ